MVGRKIKPVIGPVVNPEWRALPVSVGDRMARAKRDPVMVVETYAGPFVSQGPKRTLALKVRLSYRRDQRRAGRAAGAHPPDSHRFKFIVIKVFRLAPQSRLGQKGKCVQ